MQQILRINQQLERLLIDGNYISEGGNVGIKACLLYGSQVYGSLHAKSDHDYLMIVDPEMLDRPLDEEPLDHHHGGEGFELSIYSIATFERLLMENAEIRMVEAIFTPDKFVICGSEWLIDLRKQFLARLSGEHGDQERIKLRGEIRSSFSRKSSQSEVKARKKIIDGEMMIGLKSIFHSIRLLQFGIQLGLYGEIRDFSSGRAVWKEIMERFVPRIGTGEGERLAPKEIKDFYKQWAKTPYRLPEEPESVAPMHLLSRFKSVLPKV